MRPQAIAYVALAIADTALSRVDEGNKWRLLTKPLLMPLLASGIDHVHDKDGDRPCSRPAVHWLRGGLALSAIGDVALMRSSQRAFLTGIGSFLTAHLCYNRAFAASGSFANLRRHPKAVGAALVGGGLAIAGLTRIAPDMKPAVIAYGSAIGSMAILGFGTGRPAVKTGALLFIASDLALAIDHFVGDKVTVPRGFVMATYTTAQGLITLGLLRDEATDTDEDDTGDDEDDPGHDAPARAAAGHSPAAGRVTFGGERVSLPRR